MNKPKQAKTERIMVSIPPEMLKLLDLIRVKQMYPTRSAVIHEGIRRIATSLDGTSSEKKSSVAGEGVEKKSEEKEIADGSE